MSFKAIRRQKLISFSWTIIILLEQNIIFTTDDFVENYFSENCVRKIFLDKIISCKNDILH